MAANCPACHKDMTGRDKFITGCCNQSCCGDCLLFAKELEIQTLNGYGGDYPVCPACPKGESCAVIAWVCDVTAAELASRERYRLLKLEEARREYELAEARARETPEQRALREAQEQAQKAEERARMAADNARAKAECKGRKQVYWDWLGLITMQLSTLNQIMGRD